VKATDLEGEAGYDNAAADEDDSSFTFLEDGEGGAAASAIL
jgi:hypothetical protein